MVARHEASITTTGRSPSKSSRLAGETVWAGGGRGGAFRNLECSRGAVFEFKNSFPCECHHLRNIFFTVIKLCGTLFLEAR